MQQSGKDLLYAKIFLPDIGSSTQNTFINSQSLFCYNTEIDEYENRDFSLKNEKMFGFTTERNLNRTPQLKYKMATEKGEIEIEQFTPLSYLRNLDLEMRQNNFAETQTTQ